MATAATSHLYFTEGISTFGIYDAGTTPTLPAASAGINPVSPQTIGPIALAPGGKMYAAIPGGFEQIDPTTGLAIGNATMLPSQFLGAQISNGIAVGPDGTVYLEAFEVSTNNDDVVAFTQMAGSFTFARSFWTGNSHFSSDAITAKKSADGSVVVQFGGCDGKISNCLPTPAGWNYIVRLYRPRAEVLSGVWKFPEAQRVH
jgi:hypothetical protein